MIIQGLNKLTLLDYPEKIACTVFVGACPFRCPFCHNGSLVLAPNRSRLCYFAGAMHANVVLSKIMRALKELEAKHNS